MPRKKPRPARRPPAAATLRRGEPAGHHWRDAEQHTSATDLAARELVERAGSHERAKDAVDRVDEQHPP